MPLHLSIHLFVGFPTCVALKNKNYMPILLEKQIRHCSNVNFLCFLDDSGGAKIMVFFDQNLTWLSLKFYYKAVLNTLKRI
jgi:hypothetical protein